MESRSDADVQIVRHTRVCEQVLGWLKRAGEIKVTAGIFVPATDQSIERGSALPPTLRSLTRLTS